jgi:AraC family transcriptional regulator of adaptative response / DNA-3-methyladenine glycosylase II
VHHLHYAPPYDFRAVLRFLGTRSIAGVESVTESRYTRTITAGGVHGTLSVEADRPGRLRLTVQLPALTALPALIARARRLFDLAADPEAIAAHLATDPVLAPLIGRRPGLRVPGAWDGFEVAMRAILGQQVTVAFATRLAGRLAELCGERIVTSESSLTRVFPTPERVAAADLGSLGVPRARAKTLTSLAEAAAKDPELLCAGPGLEAAVKRLRAIPGIGEWTAQYIAMRELREPDAFPAMDAGVLRALSTTMDGPMSAARALARAEAWRPWRAYATAHLWASLSDAGTDIDEEKQNGRRVA